jgi:hypothetical protein
MWIRTEASFIPKNIKEAEFELMSDDQQYEELEWLPFRFNTDKLVAYNLCSNKEFCSVKLRGGFDFRIKMTVEQLDKHIFKVKSEQ